MKLIIAVLTITFSVSAFSLNLKEKKQFDDWKTWLTSSDSWQSAAKEKCGVDFAVTFDEGMVTPFMATSANPAAYCDGVREGMASMCEDKTYKDAIAKQVKKVHCKLGKKDELAFKMNGSTIEATMGVEAANINTKTKEFLENNLK